VRYAALLLVVMLAACATQGPTGPVPAPPAAMQPAAQAFAAEGRISVHYGEQSLSGKFAWTHAPQRDELGLATPLGNQLAQIVRDPSGVQLTNSRQERYSAPDVESLTEAQLGWRLPLAGLTDWVQGRSREVSATASRDGAGRLLQLREAGWVIDYSYAGAASLPQRLILNYPGAEQALEIRLVLDTWEAR
jgi:outer membrane lipoprotein LolB